MQALIGFCTNQLDSRLIENSLSNRDYVRPRTLIVLMSTVCLLVTAVFIYSLYKSTIKEVELLMAETALGYSRLIEAVQKFDATYSTDYPAGADLATLSQVMAAFQSLDKTRRLEGRSQEVLLGRLQADGIYFMFRQHAEAQMGGLTVPMTAESARAMRLALAGQSGTLTGKDYRGVEVLAAYQPLPGLRLGLVVQSDLSDIRGQFYEAAFYASIAAVVIITLGAYLFLKITSPLISRLRNQNASLVTTLDEIGKLEAKFEYEATHDQLTGLSSRRSLMAAIEAELARAKRYRNNLALLMCDLDHFKEVNDQYGHPVGDQTLQVFAVRAKALMRTSDLIGRYGGEEFVILLPNTDRDAGYTIAERLRREISSKEFDVTRAGIVITISIGLTVARPDEDTTDTIINRADHALYQAKSSGRNRVVSL